MNDSLKEGWEDLANAIVRQAAEDYRSALVRLRFRRRQGSARNSVRMLEQFFRSRWFRMLTDLDSETLINHLKEEPEYDHERIPGEDHGSR